MKKFHKRAAVFLTAATLAGLPAGAFFYSSPGSLTVWADNVEVESSEESSPEDVDFSDGSEAEILADPVEQAQEDAGNDVTETPEVGITFTEPEGWQTDTATVKIQVEDTKNTGDFSIAAHRAGVKQVTGIDISENMVEIGKKKVGDLHLADAIELKTGDCEHMEFATGMFDVVTVAFGVRNFEHLELGLQEMYRVLKTGGKVIILEFSMPEHFPMKQLYNFYFRYILPFVGGVISGNRKAYEYLPASVFAFPQGKNFLDIMRGAGYSNVSQQRLTFGIASLYVGEK